MISIHSHSSSAVVDFCNSHFYYYMVSRCISQRLVNVRATLHPISTDAWFLRLQMERTRCCTICKRNEIPSQYYFWALSQLYQMLFSFISNKISLHGKCGLWKMWWNRWACLRVRWFVFSRIFAYSQITSEQKKRKQTNKQTHIRNYFDAYISLCVSA